MKFCIYHLRASDEQHPFYVGKTFEGSKRLTEHKYAARNHNRMVATKIRSILTRGAEVLLEPVIWLTTEGEANAEEKRLIAQFGRRDLGTGILCNHTNGGEGCVGYRHTVDAKRRMSERKKGNIINKGRSRPDFAAIHQKPVTVFDHYGNIIYHATSGMDAAAYTQVSNKTVSDCVHGKLKSAKNGDGVVYQFRPGTIQESIGPVVFRSRDGLGAVNQYGVDGTLISSYRNSKDAENQTKIAGASIRACIHGTAKTAGGFVWKLAERLTDRPEDIN